MIFLYYELPQPSDHIKFLSLYNCTVHRIAADGNCLFRALSFLVFRIQDSHQRIRHLLVDFELLNPSIFIPYCHPLTVKEHAARMTHNHEWRTQTDIMAAAAYFQVPAVYVALKRRPDAYGQYYWAQFKVPSDVIYNDSRNNIFLDHFGHMSNIIHSLVNIMSNSL